MKRFCLLISLTLLAGVQLHGQQTEIERAIFEERRAKAEKGDAASQCAIAEHYAHGSLGVTKNLEDAVKWFRKSAELERVKEQLANRVRLHAKEVMMRYGMGKTSLYRNLKRGKMPKPIRWASPFWSLAELEAAEEAGRLPRPKSDTARTRPASGVRV